MSLQQNTILSVLGQQPYTTSISVKHLTFSSNLMCSHHFPTQNSTDDQKHVWMFSFSFFVWNKHNFLRQYILPHPIHFTSLARRTVNKNDLCAKFFVNLYVLVGGETGPLLHRNFVNWMIHFGCVRQRVYSFTALSPGYYWGRYAHIYR